jgi:tRNA pseudouridine38-40 synthase
MFNIKLLISYLGTPFLGWQKTNMGPSIEATLESALEKILRHPVTLQAASRTDAGVHAEGQVVNFQAHCPVDPRRLKHSLNGLLPKEISVLEVVAVPKAFHPTLDSLKKEYWYHVCTGFSQLPFYRNASWHFPFALNHEAMQRAASDLLGTHDFSAFCNERALWDRDPVCTLERIELTPLPQDRLRISFVGDHFLYRMARNLAGTLAYIGSGKLDPSCIPSLLKNKDRTLAGMTAPAHGLTLKHVFYS